jgi:glycosyltransferase involved in cell wall biosynthesis
MTPKVCVAICNYNHTRFLKESIQSIVNQKYSNLDIVVVDDGSKDQDVVREIINLISDNRIRFIPISKNSGKWNALNTAFASTDAVICTSHDADDISLGWRIGAQLEALVSTKTAHNLCGFISCWSEEEVIQGKEILEPKTLRFGHGPEIQQLVIKGFETPGINHYFTGNFETAGVSAMFYKRIWDLGYRFNPPNCGIRVLHSEDSDFNFRVTANLGLTSILAETPYLYRRNTSTNFEEK